MIIPRIQDSPERKLIGMRITTSLSNNRIPELWKKFSPRRNEVRGAVSAELISMAVYSSVYFTEFKPTNEFERWAAIEVSDFNNVPVEMETFILGRGLYAVFDYKGSSSDTSIFQYIFGAWLPSSGYELDSRPHYEVLGENYKNNNAESEEEIWIPIKVAAHL